MTMLRRLRWPLFGLYVAAATIALLFAAPAGLSLLGLPPDRVSFGPAMVTGLPWSLIALLFRPDAVTTLALLAVSHVLNLAVGLMLARDASD